MTVAANEAMRVELSFKVFQLFDNRGKLGVIVYSSTSEGGYRKSFMQFFKSNFLVI